MTAETDRDRRRPETRQADGNAGLPALEETDRIVRSARPIVVFVHVHYPEVWESMAGMLSNRLKSPFRLVLTSSLPNLQFAVPATPFLTETLVVRVENRGRDILPFLVALRRVGDFDIGLKLHTKRSAHRLEGEAWRLAVLSALLPPASEPSPGRTLDADPRIGLIAPAGFLLPLREWELTNRPKMAVVSSACGRRLDRTEVATGSFAAGSMFWFRRTALSPLADTVPLELFEPEARQTDGTIAHAIERLFAVVARRNGFAVLPSNAVANLSPSLTDGELALLAQERSAEVHPMFCKPFATRALAKHAPLLFRLYGRLPAGLRRRLRDSTEKVRWPKPPVAR